MASVEMNLDDLLSAVEPAPFKPYCFMSPESDTLTIYFRNDPDYSERLTDHVTLYRSISNRELVGCRIKNMSGILADLPNSIKVDHDGIRLEVVFYAFRSDQRVYDYFKKLAREVGDLKVPVPAVAA